MTLPEGTAVSHVSPLAGARQVPLDEPGSRNVGQVELSALCWVPGGAAALCPEPSLPRGSPDLSVTCPSNVPS